MEIDHRVAPEYLKVSAFRYTYYKTMMGYCSFKKIFLDFYVNDLIKT